MKKNERGRRQKMTTDCKEAYNRLQRKIVVKNKGDIGKKLQVGIILQCNDHRLQRSLYNLGKNFVSDGHFCNILIRTLSFSDIIQKGTSTNCLCQIGPILRLHNNPKSLLHCTMR